ncbi:MAG: flavin-containing monooxygenase [Parasphingopyxis sp.]
MTQPDFDAIVVGAGFAGLYMLHELREHGFSARVYEAGSDVGGTWYWNRYPGARCDIESMEYSFSFDEDLQQEWEWSERYATQPEILRYLEHVAERFDLRRDIRFDTRVASARWHEEARLWRIETERGETATARHLIMGTGCLSSVNRPDIPGLDDFAGETWITGLWPHEGVDFTGRKVAVIGTGSSAVQSIPVIAREAERVTVFQRTPNFVVPAHNHPLDKDRQDAIKADYAALREAARKGAAGIRLPGGRAEKLALNSTEEERRAEYEKRWAYGGLTFMAAYADLGLIRESNETAADFIRGKIRERVEDPETAGKLCPTDHPAGAKRMCVDIGYYETYNEDHVELVDIRETPIARVTATGVETGDRLYEVDSIVLATGFDAMTGTLSRIDIRGRGGAKLKDKWEAGPTTYLGLMSAGFPNLFLVTGPGSPSVLSNMIVSIEQHVEYIADTLVALRSRGADTIEPLEAAEQSWVEHVNEVAAPTVMMQANSWYLGANIPGKPRIFMPYIGGVPTYRKICAHIAQAGYAGFAIDGEANETPVDYHGFIDIPEALLALLPAEEAAAGDAAVAG